MSHDPIRLHEDPASPDGLRELMAHGAPPPRLDSVTKAASAAAVATLASGGAAAASTATATAAGAKLWLVIGGLAVTGLVAGGIAIGVGSLSEEPPAAAPPTASAPSVTPAPSRVAHEETQAPDEDATAIEPTIDDAPPAEAHPVARDGARREASTTPEEHGAGGLVVEASLLEEARSLLQTDPATALAATERHRREHPDAQLAAERELIAIDALQRLGRGAQARPRAQRLLDRAPSGIYAERARAILRDLPE